MKLHDYGKKKWTKFPAPLGPTINSNIEKAIPEIIGKKKNRKTRINTIPNNPNLSSPRDIFFGKNVVSIFEPSSGGKGRRLKTASSILRNTTKPRSDSIVWPNR